MNSWELLGPSRSNSPATLAEAEGLPLRAIPVTRNAKAADVNGLDTLAKLATESREVIADDRDATIVKLQAQALRFQAAFDAVAQGVCFFDGEERLILSNRRFAEIYRLAPEQIRPGATLREIVELRVAAGTCAAATADDYLSFCESNDAGKERMIWTAELQDGRTHSNAPPADARRRLDRDA